MDAITSYGLEFPVSVWMKRVNPAVEPRVIVVIEPVERTSAHFTVNEKVMEELLQVARIPKPLDHSSFSSFSFSCSYSLSTLFPSATSLLLFDLSSSSLFLFLYLPPQPFLLFLLLNPFSSSSSSTLSPLLFPPSSLPHSPSLYLLFSSSPLHFLSPSFPCPPLFFLSPPLSPLCLTLPHLSSPFSRVLWCLLIPGLRVYLGSLPPVRWWVGLCWSSSHPC